jgi:signal transduction histidine kinase
MTVGTSLGSEFTLAGAPRPLSPQWEENLLRIGQEALTNALRHGSATRFKAHLHFHAQKLTLDLSDDGCGFDPAANHEGFGLAGMRERVEQMSGEISVQSAQGRGTTILITLPLIEMFIS